MNKSFWIGFVVVYLVAQVLAFLVHGVWLESTYQPLYGTVFRPLAEFEQAMWMMFVSGLIYIFLFCYIFTKGYEGGGVAEGLRYGLLIGVFFSLPMSIDNYVVYPLPLNLVVTWLVTGIVNFAIAGAVFAAIYKPATTSRAAAAA